MHENDTVLPAQKFKRDLGAARSPAGIVDRHPRKDKEYTAQQVSAFIADMERARKDILNSAVI